MALIANQIPLFFLLALLSSLHIQARDTQLFNKVPSTTPDNVVPKKTDPQQQQQQKQEQEQEPNFLPENENSYGIYGHESGQLPPSATTLPNAKYLPKNYNPVAYVTMPENTDEDSNNNFNNYNNMRGNYFNNGARNTYTRQEEDEPNNYYYNGGSSFNSQPLTDAKYDGGAAAAGRYSFQPQGMSDTRHLERGKYFYDINTGRYSREHPYQSLRGVRRNYDGGNGVNNEYGQFNDDAVVGGRNSMGWYQNVQNEYQQEEQNYNMP